MEYGKLTLSLAALAVASAALVGCSGDSNTPKPVETVEVEHESEPGKPANPKLAAAQDAILAEIPVAVEGTAVNSIFTGIPDAPTFAVLVLIEDGSEFTYEDFEKTFNILKDNRPEGTTSAFITVQKTSGDIVDISGYAEQLRPGNWEPNETTGGVGVTLIDGEQVDIS